MPIRKLKRWSGPNAEMMSSRACSISTEPLPSGFSAVGQLAEEAEVVAQRAGREEVHLLRKLEVVLDERAPGVVVARLVEVGHLDVQREGDVPGKRGRIDHLRPHPRVGLRPEGDRLLLDLLLGLSRQVVAVQPEGLAERVELREDRVAGLTGRLVLAGEDRDSRRRTGAPEHGQSTDHEHSEDCGASVPDEHGRAPFHPLRGGGNVRLPSPLLHRARSPIRVGKAH